jgi:hypothetical protein
LEGGSAARFASKQNNAKKEAKQWFLQVNEMDLSEKERNKKSETEKVP